ncbi:MAG: DUF4270 domain-containing protein [Prevotella sp.]|nr:DUF4270 domain-containing protein [Prevotella sp.]
MKNKIIVGMTACVLAFSACTEETGTLGGSLINSADYLNMTKGTQMVTTRSIPIGAVLSSTSQCYIGRVLDPATEIAVTCNFMSQFNMVENPEVAPMENIMNHYGGVIDTDSCELRIYFDTDELYGDTLTALKMRITELNGPVDETKNVYTDFDPKDEDLLRLDGKGIRINRMFSIHDQSLPDSLRGTSNFVPFIRLMFDNDTPYTSLDGKSYKNYGTYILQRYFENKDYFKNAYNFIRHVCPGFYFEITDGIGVMTGIQEIDLVVYYSSTDGTTVSHNMLRSAATEEVLQATTVENDMERVEELAQDKTCSFMKTPAAMFTEVNIPVLDIMKGHENDSLLSASITFQRLNEWDDDKGQVVPANEYTIRPPKNVLLIERDSMFTFFENKLLPDDYSAYYSTFDEYDNQYEFSNICHLVMRMYNTYKKKVAEDPNWVAEHPNWNKAVLIPIDVVTTTTSSDAEAISSVHNDMSLTSARLIGGDPEKGGTPIKINLIYGQFNVK